MTLPGVPFVIVGHNEHVAWGFTNSGADAQDIYIEQISNGRYRADDGTDRLLGYAHERVRVKGSSDVTLDIPLTQHGNAPVPVISGLFPRETRSLGLRWTLYEPGFASQPFGRVNTAGSGAELAAAFDRFGGPSQNLVYADDAGHIGYHLIGWVPLRGVQGRNGIPPVPVPSGNYEWSGFIPYTELVHVEDPASGIVATANARINSDNYPYPLALDWELPYRNERIWKVLGSGKGLTAASMTALQNDTNSAFDKTIAERVSYAVDHAKSPTKRDREAANLLRAWNGDVSGSSSAANITQAVRVALLPMLLEPHLPDKESVDLYTWRSRSYALEMILANAPARWLPTRYPDWNEFLTAALERGLDQQQAPSHLRDWTWARTHTMRLDHPVFGSAWYLRALAGPTGTKDTAIPGNAFTVHVSNGVHSASERFVADLANLPASTMTLPQGESGQVGSPYYLDQWPSWAAGEALSLPFGAAAAPSHTLTLRP